MSAKGQSLLIFVALIISRHVGFSGYPDSSQLNLLIGEGWVSGRIKEEGMSNRKALISFDTAILTKISANHYIFPCFLFKLLAQEEACPYIAKLFPCQDILAYELERISFGELTSFEHQFNYKWAALCKKRKKIRCS